MQNIAVFVASDQQEPGWYQAFTTALAQDVSVTNEVQHSDVIIVPVTTRPLTRDQHTQLYTGLNQHRYLMGLLGTPAPRHTWPILHHVMDVIEVTPTEASHRVALTLTQLGEQIHPPDPLPALLQGHPLALPERINASAELIALMQPTVLRFFANHVDDLEQCDELVGDTSLAVATILRREPHRAAGLSPQAFVMQCARAQLRTYRRTKDRWDDLR